MSDNLDKRLEQILPKITSDSFLRATGLGNEIAFHIFDYPPEKELYVRKHLKWLLEQIPRQRPDIKVVHVNLLDFLIEYLDKRKILDKTFQIQLEKGDEALTRALRGPLQEQRLAKEFIDYAKPDQYDLLLISGVGSVYPMIRSRSLLSNLQHHMPNIPLVLFYPGRYDGITLRLFGKSSISQAGSGGKSNSKEPYYRAFRLIPEETKYAN